MDFSCPDHDYSELPLDLLLERVQHDDPQERAMNEIVHRFHKKAAAIARRLTADFHLREDLMNESLAALAHAARSHKLGQPGFPAYAEICMKGAAYRAWSKQHESRLLLVDDLAKEFDRSSTEAIHADTWGGGSTWEAINSLPSDKQRLLHERYVDDRSQAEMAAAEGVSVSAISQRLSTAHKLMRRALAA